MEFWFKKLKLARLDFVLKVMKASLVAFVQMAMLNSEVNLFLF